MMIPPAKSNTGPIKATTMALKRNTLDNSLFSNAKLISPANKLIKIKPLKKYMECCIKRNCIKYKATLTDTINPVQFIDLLDHASFLISRSCPAYTVLA